MSSRPTCVRSPGSTPRGGTKSRRCSVAEVKCRCWKPTDPQIDCPLTEHRTAARVRLDVEAAIRAERDDHEAPGTVDAHHRWRLPPVSLSVPKTVIILGQEFTVKVLTR